MEQKQQKKKNSENLWHSREELTGKNLRAPRIEPRTFQTKVKYLNN